MNSKQRAELQRKLSLNAVPRPPAGLAERIKADIPKYLDTEVERAKFSRNVAFNMRIAASVLLAITTAGVTLFYVERHSASKEASFAQPGVFAPAPRALQAPATTSTPAEEVRLDISEEPEPEVPRIPMPAPVVAAPPAPQAQTFAYHEEKKNEVDVDRADTQVASGRLADHEDGVAFDAVQETAKVRQEPASVAEVGPPPEPVPTAVAEAPAAPAPPAATAMTMNAAAGVASKLARDQRRAGVAKDDDVEGSIFGISVDPEVFQDIRATLENGERPRVSANDVEALVNYFAGAPAERPRRDPSLEVEASPAPIEAEGDHAILRFTIDTPNADVTTPVATDARIDILLNSNSVEKAHRIGANQAPATESALHYNTSVTGLYALELRPNLTASQVVATVRLHYVEAGRARTVSRVVYGKDLARGWKNASRRHRLASLGAIWGETLRDMAPGIDVARRAEELASQNPKDSRAKELAAAASASADGER